ncbi:major facilitator superfamily MFS-1 protein [Babesia caballi]|uniref:Major facilitator superfamily MFS-1 protein n=1 Tax=Babesia caballi TaxID=5871 RepID=A0AAV4LZB0_BABCB|nr:major facilitator superfamily MFS-1 protein [Babesia caballi]
MASTSTNEQSCAKRLKIDTVDPKLLPPPHINVYLRLGIYLYYIFSSGCIYWGWNGLQEILYKAGAFEDYCVAENASPPRSLYGVDYVDCPDRAGGINNLYTLAYATHFICSFFSGWLLDKFGPRVCFMVGHVFSIVAWALVFCLPRNGIVLRVSFVLIGLFCEACYIPLLSMSKYFPKGASTIIAVMGSMRSVSYFVPTLLSWIYHTPAIAKESLWIIGLCYLLIANVLCLASGFFIVPKDTPISPSDKGAITPTESEIKSAGESEPESVVAPAGTEKGSIVDTIRGGFRSPLLVEFIILCLSVCLFMPSIEFINKSQADLLIASGDGGDATGVFKYVNILTFVPGPFLGAVMDKIGPAIVMNFLHTCALLYYVCASIDVYAMKIAACGCYLFAGSLCISTVYCYINTRFPAQYFGVLVTVIFGLAGLVTLANIPIYNWGLTLVAEIREQRFRPLTFLFMIDLNFKPIEVRYVAHRRLDDEGVAVAVHEHVVELALGQRQAQEERVVAGLAASQHVRPALALGLLQNVVQILHRPLAFGQPALLVAELEVEGREKADRSRRRLGQQCPRAAVVAGEADLAEPGLVEVLGVEEVRLKLVVRHKLNGVTTKRSSPPRRCADSASAPPAPWGR